MTPEEILERAIKIQREVVKRWGDEYRTVIELLDDGSGCVRVYDYGWQDEADKAQVSFDSLDDLPSALNRVYAEVTSYG